MLFGGILLPTISKSLVHYVCALLFNFLPVYCVVTFNTYDSAYLCNPILSNVFSFCLFGFGSNDTQYF